MILEPHRPYRRSIRLKGYDYGGAGVYFLTICTHERQCLLGRLEDGAVIPSRYGLVVAECWGMVPQHFASVELDMFVVMPNHIHGVLTILERRDETSARDLPGVMPNRGMHHPPAAHGTRPGSVGAIVQNFKSVSTRMVNRLGRASATPVWQRNYYEHVIRNEDELDRIRQYILENPQRWEMDENNPNRHPPWGRM